MRTIADLTDEEVMQLSKLLINNRKPMKHTPGPWSVFNIKNIFIRGADINSDLSNIEADARLIAAAPELLDILKGIVFYQPAGITTQELQDFQTLISKIEGKS